jgi:hypothetical protein
VDTAPNIMEIIKEEEFKTESIYLSTDSQSEQILDIEIERGSQEKIIQQLEEKYGIKLERVVTEMRQIVVNQ